ncbi:MAG: hypothetical protein CL569_11510 [Alphaproteobacteria bacterium]|nr:hypothetical protein [Alphaproteobacteria bacterium]|tara:strand:+ start:5478 stop:6173 length:696 start_codon:yes stop_codon:yes gene_type:complete
MTHSEVVRKLAAVMAADVAVYSRLMSADEEGTLIAMRGILTDVIEPCVDAHQGRIFKTLGDGFLAGFASVVEAVRCALEIQQRATQANLGLSSEARIESRIGINLGNVMMEGDDVYGDGVNVAARLQELAQPGGICLSGAARDQVRDRFGFSFSDRGNVQVKNIQGPVRLYDVSDGSTGDVQDPHQGLSLRGAFSRYTWLTSLVLIYIALLGVAWWYWEASGQRHARDLER